MYKRFPEIFIKNNTALISSNSALKSPFSQFCNSFFEKIPRVVLAINLVLLGLWIYGLDLIIASEKYEIL